MNWNDYPVWARRGSIMTRVQEEGVVTYVDGRTKETVTTPVTRRNWQVLGAPRFTAEPDGWLWRNLPLHSIPATGGGDLSVSAGTLTARADQSDDTNQTDMKEAAS